MTMPSHRRRRPDQATAHFVSGVSALAARLQFHRCPLTRWVANSAVGASRFHRLYSERFVNWSGCEYEINVHACSLSDWTPVAPLPADEFPVKCRSITDRRVISRPADAASQSGGI